MLFANSPLLLFNIQLLPFLHSLWHFNVSALLMVTTCVKNSSDAYEHRDECDKRQQKTVCIISFWALSYYNFSLESIDADKARTKDKRWSRTRWLCQMGRCQRCKLQDRHRNTFNKQRLHLCLLQKLCWSLKW